MGHETGLEPAPEQPEDRASDEDSGGDSSSGSGSGGDTVDLGPIKVDPGDGDTGSTGGSGGGSSGGGSSSGGGTGSTGSTGSGESESSGGSSSGGGGGGSPSDPDDASDLRPAKIQPEDRAKAEKSGKSAEEIAEERLASEQKQEAQENLETIQEKEQRIEEQRQKFKSKVESARENPGKKVDEEAVSEQLKQFSEAEIALNQLEDKARRGVASAEELVENVDKVDVAPAASGGLTVAAESSGGGGEKVSAEEFQSAVQSAVERQKEPGRTQVADSGNVLIQPGLNFEQQDFRSGVQDSIPEQIGQVGRAGVDFVGEVATGGDPRDELKDLTREQQGLAFGVLKRGEKVGDVAETGFKGLVPGKPPGEEIAGSLVGGASTVGTQFIGSVGGGAARTTELAVEATEKPVKAVEETGQNLAAGTALIGRELSQNPAEFAAEETGEEIGEVITFGAAGGVAGIAAAGIPTVEPDPTPTVSTPETSPGKPVQLREGDIPAAADVPRGFAGGGTVEEGVTPEQVRSVETDVVQRGPGVEITRKGAGPEVVARTPPEPSEVTGPEGETTETRATPLEPGTPDQPRSPVEQETGFTPEEQEIVEQSRGREDVTIFEEERSGRVRLKAENTETGPMVLSTAVPVPVPDIRPEPDDVDVPPQPAADPTLLTSETQSPGIEPVSSRSTVTGSRSTPATDVEPDLTVSADLELTPTTVERSASQVEPRTSPQQQPSAEPEIVQEPEQTPETVQEPELVPDPTVQPQPEPEPSLEPAPEPEISPTPTTELTPEIENLPDDDSNEEEELLPELNINRDREFAPSVTGVEFNIEASEEEVETILEEGATGFGIRGERR